MRYVSSCSGASWFNAAFSFADTPLSTFLGHYIPPENLDFLYLSKLEPPGSFGKATSQASFISGAAIVGPCERVIKFEGGGSGGVRG